MSKKELDIFKKGLPSHLKGIGLDEATKKLMGKTAGGSKRISIKGSVFRMIVNGEETAVSEERSQNWIVVAVSDDVQRVFFEGTYKEGQTMSPRCWSENSKMPDANVPDPVSKSCETCPNNVQGSSSTGGKACRHSMRVAVMLENDPTHSIYQVVLPSASIFGNGEHYKWPFRAYGKYLGLNGVSISLVVTKASFDIKSPTPKLTFAPVREVTAEEYEVIKTKYEAEETIKATKLNIMPPESKPKTIADNSDEPVVKAKKETGEKPQSASDIAKKWANE
jgi:hypothetical protein